MRFVKRSIRLDTPINSPFESILFIDKMQTILRENRCSITSECRIEGEIFLEFVM